MLAVRCSVDFRDLVAEAVEIFGQGQLKISGGLLQLAWGPLQTFLAAVTPPSMPPHNAPPPTWPVSIRTA